MLDFRIDNARLFDGDGFRTEKCVGIQGNSVAYIGDDSPPSRVLVDGTSKILTPAFVDTHSHADFMVTHDDNDGGSSISQGVGTLVVGNCGYSTTPMTAPFPILFNKVDDTNLDLERHLEKVREGLSLNVGELVGHSTLRMSVLGQARKARRSEIDKMSSLLRQFLEAGWVGMSVGLNYPEAVGYSSAELLALCRVLARYNRPLTCHIRDQGMDIIAAMDEVITITSQAGCPVLISHLRPLANRPDRTVSEMERRIDVNHHASFDMYPYVAGCTTLAWFFEYMFGRTPKESMRFQSDDIDAAIRSVCINGYDDVHIMRHRTPAFIRRTVGDIARQLGEEPGQVLQTVYISDSDCMCIYDNQSRHADVDHLIQHDRCLIGSDAWLYPACYDGSCHPRNFAAFTGFLTRYVRNGPIDLVAGLKRITSRSADYFGLDAGRIAVGHRADMLLFALDGLRENASFDDPAKLSAGVDHVWIAGRPVFRNGEMPHTPIRPGVRLHASSH